MTQLGTQAGAWLAGGEAPALARLTFPLVPARRTKVARGSLPSPASGSGSRTGWLRGLAHDEDHSCVRAITTAPDGIGLIVVKVETGPGRAVRARLRDVHAARDAGRRGRR